MLFLWSSKINLSPYNFPKTNIKSECQGWFHTLLHPCLKFSTLALIILNFLSYNFENTCYSYGNEKSTFVLIVLQKHKISNISPNFDTFTSVLEIFNFCSYNFLWFDFTSLNCIRFILFILFTSIFYDTQTYSAINVESINYYPEFSS